MIYESPDRPSAPSPRRGARDLAIGLVALSLVSAALLTYALGYYCDARSGWPCLRGHATTAAPAAADVDALETPVPLLPGGVPAQLAVPTALAATPPLVPQSPTESPDRGLQDILATSAAESAWPTTALPTAWLRPTVTAIVLPTVEFALPPLADPATPPTPRQTSGGTSAGTPTLTPSASAAPSETPYP